MLTNRIELECQRSFFGWFDAAQHSVQILPDGAYSESKKFACTFGHVSEVGEPVKLDDRCERPARSPIAPMTAQENNEHETSSQINQ